jgi:hypothetical protein
MPQQNQLNVVGKVPMLVFAPQRTHEKASAVGQSTGVTSSREGSLATASPSLRAAATTREAGGVGEW